MIDRQNKQLVAGIQELYRRMQSKGGGIGPQLDNHGMPGTHQILEALGVLYTNEKWDETEGPEGTPRISELQPPVDVSIGTLASSFPRYQRVYVQLPPLAFVHSTLLSNRLRES